MSKAHKTETPEAEAPGFLKVAVASPAGFENGASDQQVGETAELFENPRDSEARSEAIGSPDAASVAPDPVEAALAEALTKASIAGEWATVEALSRELAARREARAGVVDLSAERKRRNGGAS